MLLRLQEGRNVEINNPIHQLETNKTNWKYNSRVFVYVGRSNAKNSLRASVLLAETCKLGEVGVRRGRQTLVFPMQIYEGGGGCGGGRRARFAAVRGRQRQLAAVGCVRLVGGAGGQEFGPQRVGLVGGKVVIPRERVIGRRLLAAAAVAHSLAGLARGTTMVGVAGMSRRLTVAAGVALGRARRGLGAALCGIVEGGGRELGRARELLDESLLALLHLNGIVEGDGVWY